MKKLFVFNGAGTLLDSDTSGFRWLAGVIGKKKEEREHLKQYMKAKKEGPWGLSELAALFTGIRRAEVDAKAKIFVKERLMQGAEELVSYLKANRFYVAFYSSDIMEICNALKQELDLDDVRGNKLEYVKGMATGKLEEKVDRYDRADIIKKLVEKNNLGKGNVYIVGNSMTALPSIRYGKFISFNAGKKDAKEVNKSADIVVEGNDLTDVIALIKKAW